MFFQHFLNISPLKETGVIQITRYHESCVFTTFSHILIITSSDILISGNSKKEEKSKNLGCLHVNVHSNFYQPHLAPTDMLFENNPTA